MTRNEINRYDMMKSVEELFTENASLIENYPQLSQAHAKLRALCNEIFTVNSQQSVTTKGITAQKTEKRTELTTTLIKVIDALKAHAAATGDVKLKAESNFSASDINRLRDNDLAVLSQSIYTLAKPLAAHLALWNISETKIDALETQRQIVMQKTPVIRNVRATSAQATKELKEKFKETTSLFKNTIDPMMLPFKTINPAFYGKYRNARVIIDRTATYSTANEGEGTNLTS